MNLPGNESSLLIVQTDKITNYLKCMHTQIFSRFEIGISFLFYFKISYLIIMFCFLRIG